MAVYENREAFIPYRRADIIELCLEDGQLPSSDLQKFREFCEILSAYFHFKFHQTLEVLKDNFAPFNPDADTKLRIEPSPEARQQMAAKLASAFHNLLQSANYVAISEDSLQRAFAEKSLIELKTKVEFDDFDQIVCYCRGDIYRMTWVKKWFRKVEKTLDVFERVALLIKFKEKAYFESKSDKSQKLSFTPGKMYVYLYKNIPKFDMEFLFPNVKVSMTWKDRLLLIVPAMGAAVPVLIKALPQILLIVGVILFYTGNIPGLEDLKASEDQVRNFMPVLAAILSMTVAFGGLAFKQYNSYKNKQLKFQKNVTDTLFFRNLANNMGVFHSLIDAAEEEECKEIILVYYHLLTSNGALTKEQLDNQIESWMDRKFGTKIDFDINGPLRNLEEIRGKIIKEGIEEANIQETPLLSYDRDGCCQVLPLEDAKMLIDYVWDNAFAYW
ncbi:MAG: DUF3754 domain-containing protein [Oscillatoria sp. SIO1A7]|nr:DUF3754 domain-containing protein [Oscillatoria sp. SIO1A7]